MYSEISNNTLVKFDDRDAINGKYNLPRNVEEIGPFAISEDVKIECFVFNNKVKKVKNGLFHNCKQIKNIILSNSITTIERGAFYNCGLESIEIPKSVVQIEPGAFCDCKNLKTITIPNSVKTLKNLLFGGCTSLEEVYIGNSVDNIEKRCFEGCEKLKTIHFPKSLIKISESAFDNCGIEKIELPYELQELGEYAFNQCKNLKVVKFGDKLRKIENGTFSDCVLLEEVVLPKNLKEISAGAFANCESLKSLQLGDNVSVIGERAFDGCTSLHTINLPQGLIKIGYNAFKNCTSLKKIVFPGSLTYIEQSLFHNCTSLENVVLNEGIISIGMEVFTNCINLKQVELPISVKSIRNRAFDGCKNLSSINLENVETISFYAFEGCTSLEEIRLDNVKSIGVSAFKNCSNLKTVYLSSNLEFIGENIFKNCTSLTSVIIDGVKINLTQEQKDNFGAIYPFLVYVAKNNKFIPRNLSVMTRTKKDEIANFYQKSDAWKEVLDLYLKTHHDYLVSHEKMEINYAIENLYQMCVVLGLFQEGENGDIAKAFILKEIIKMHPNTLHEYGAMDTKKYGYNEEFAKFYIKNYRSTENADGCRFFEAKEQDYYGEEIVNFASKAYNNWEKVKLAYPNKTVLAHREQGSENNNITEEDIYNAINTTVYENVFEGNEEMAEIVGRYGYTQEEFELLQDWYEKAKKIKHSTSLKIGKDTENKGITFVVLEKDDIEGLILGEETNCCQTVDDAGRSCVEYGLTKPNSCFVKFCVDGKLIGQSWIWYNEKTGVVCLDNIEVPTIWKKQLKRSEVEQNFLKCLIRLAEMIKSEMEKNGKVVTMVTVGAGYNDLPGIKRFERINTNKGVLPSDYNGYSDAISEQYVIPSELIATSQLQIKI